MTEFSSGWTVADAAALYNIDGWGSGYFSVAENGTLHVRPSPSLPHTICLASLVQDLQQRGIHTPLLIRFADVLYDRIAALNSAFDTAIADLKYRGDYCCVYPVKVNEQRHVVRTMVNGGRAHGLGLEVGSKPELLVALGMLDTDAPLLCNGYKDEEFIELALLGRKLGMNVMPVIEKAGELQLILRTAQELEIDPVFGIRSRLSSRGSGRWHASTGDRAKFGLTAAEIVSAVDTLQQADQLSGLRLLHFHLGSQICEVGKLRAALREAVRFYIELYRLGAPLGYLDIGGGLAVDYDGTRTAAEASANYTLQEYATTVVYEVMAACDDAGVPHPQIVSESGRALTAHHAVLVTNVLGTRTAPALHEAVGSVSDDAPRVVQDLAEYIDSPQGVDPQEMVHDLRYHLDQLHDLFRLGIISLSWRAAGETLYWAGLRQAYALNLAAAHPADELISMRRELADIYFCNLSVFQSLPDMWAIDQVFPVMPICRLNERPDVDAILADITCDSDGKVDRFVGPHGVTRTLPVHQLGDEPYLLAFFLVGAYQEVLGDLHNLFGDTHAVHIEWDDESDTYGIDHVEDGDTVTEVLTYMQHSRDKLVSRFRRRVEKRVRAGALTAADSRAMLDAYRAGFEGYTYME
jgi:arginine decarboxylase